MPLVLLVNPPNTNQVLDETPCSLTRPEDLTDCPNVPSLGVLTLASALQDIPHVTAVYLDGTIVPWSEILRFIEDHAGDLLAVCVSMLTASYEAGLALLRHAKAIRPGIRTIAGNDHISALPRACLTHQQDCIDFAFAGNEVVGPFRSLIADLHRGTLQAPARYPGLVGWTSDGLTETPQRPEPIFTGYDYPLIDAVYPHTAQYQANFASRMAPRLRELLGIPVRNGVPMELARGCIKFSRDDPCTFGGLLREMASAAPSWWRGLPEDERPVFGGYARADGLSNPRHTATLRELGIRYLMVGLDAGSPVSLSALNKPLAPARGGDPKYRAERMFQHNLDALDRARDEGIFLKAGFVVGHLGMTQSLLEENIQSICALVDRGKGAIASSDIEVLSPEPDLATAAAWRLGLTIAGADVRAGIAARYAGLDLIDREQAMGDYVCAVMPELILDDLARARERLREHCRSNGVFVGE